MLRQAEAVSSSRQAAQDEARAQRAACAVSRVGQDLPSLLLTSLADSAHAKLSCCRVPRTSWHCQAHEEQEALQEAQREHSQLLQRARLAADAHAVMQVMHSTALETCGPVDHCPYNTSRLCTAQCPHMLVPL